MGQNPPKTQSFGLTGHWHKLKRGNLHHCFTKAEILQLEGQSQQISITYSPIQSKSTQQIIDIYKYYQTRSTLTSHQHLITLLKFQLIDPKGNDMTGQIQSNIAGLQKNSKDKVNVNTLCNLNIFEGYCNRSIFQEKARFYGEIKMVQEYLANNLQFESQKRREKGQPYTEKELFDIIITAVQAALLLLNSQLKQPLLSPLAIKITPNGKLKFGQWQCSHLFEDKHQHEEQTNFIEEGEMYLQPEITSKEKQTQTQITQFNVLTHYYWAPEGTTAMQSTINVGAQSSRNSCKGQIFSLGMTILHLLLQRPLYQKQTYSQRLINQYIQEAVDFRQTSKQPLSADMISILKKMLAWDPKERINYYQLEAELVEFRDKYSQRSRSIWSSSAQGHRSVRVPIAKSVIVRDIDGSGSVDQGYGDQIHPEAEALDNRPLNTLRLKAQECSLDYQKIDYTIRRQRKEWQLFQNRLSTSNSYQSQPAQLYSTNPACKKPLLGVQPLSKSIMKVYQSFPAEIMLQQDQDYPNEEQLCCLEPDNRRQLQVTDQEQQSLSSQQYHSGVTDSIKLLDISNINIHNSTQKCHQNKINLQSTNKLFGHLFEHQDSFSKMLHAKNINIQAFMNQSDSLLLKSSVSPRLQKENQNNKHNQDLFTSPELMALIRSSAYRSKENQPSSYRNAKLELSPEPIRKKQKTNNELTFSTYVKEQFAKGWYEGAKSQGLRNGYGTFHYNQGGKYCGDWLNSQMHGQGTLYYADGRIAYQGEWRFDSLNGKGILYNENPRNIQGKFDYRNFNLSEDVWVYYEGNFVNDDKNGKGILLLSNGERYEGDFQDDLIQGHGTFYSLEGEIIKGEWKANRLVKISSIDQIEDLQANLSSIQMKQ